MKKEWMDQAMAAAIDAATNAPAADITQWATRAVWRVFTETAGAEKDARIADQAEMLARASGAVHAAVQLVGLRSHALDDCGKADYTKLIRLDKALAKEVGEL
jgi:hypothetical protein